MDHLSSSSTLTHLTWITTLPHLHKKTLSKKFPLILISPFSPKNRDVLKIYKRNSFKNSSDQKKVHQKIELTFNLNKEISLKVPLNKKISIVKFTSKTPCTTVKLETRLAKGCEFTKEIL